MYTWTLKGGAGGVQLACLSGALDLPAASHYHSGALLLSLFINLKILTSTHHTLALGWRCSEMSES